MSHLPSKQALCSHPLGQSWPLSPSHPPLARPKGLALGRFCGEEDGGLAWGYPNPSHHAPGEHGTTQPREASPGGKWEGWLWRCPAPAAGVFWIPERAAPSCPASSTSKMLPGWGPCRLLQRRHSPAPGEGLPWWREPLSHRSPLKGDKVCTGVNWDPNLAQLCNCGDPWGSGILCGFCKAPKCMQGRLGFGGAGDGYGRFRAGIQDLHHTPSVQGEEGGAHSSPGNAKCHYTPSLNPHPSPTLLHPTRA